MINQSIEQHAQALLARHAITQPAIPVELMARTEGIQVVRSPGSGQESGFLLRDSTRTVIGLNSNNSATRQRFTIAHELGHWQLHEGRPLIVDHTIRVNNRNEVSSAATDHEEIAANAFAAALLMPINMIDIAIRRSLELGINTPEALTHQLAMEFDVSTQAMQIRLVNLGVFN